MHLAEKGYPIASYACITKLNAVNFVRCSTESWNLYLNNWFDEQIDTFTIEQRTLVFILTFYSAKSIPSSTAR